jgi:DNA-binding transcriptional ArsR family regulator
MDAAAVKATLGDDARAERIAGFLKAMGHPMRLRVLARLACEGEQSVGDLCHGLGLAQAAVSQQLSVLRLHGLVAVRREGGFRKYALAVDEVRTMLACMTRCHLAQGDRAEA